MDVIIKPRGEIKFYMPVNDIVSDINELPLYDRFKVINKILKKVQLKNKNELSTEQTAIILNFLRRTYELYSNKLLK